MTDVQRVMADIADAADADLDLGPHRYCVPCNIRWVGTEPCFGCGQPGELSEFTDPPGWPATTIAEALEPGPT